MKRIRIQKVPEPPCVAFKCSELEHCAVVRHACSAFAAYVYTGRVFDPHTNVRVVKDENHNPRCEVVGAFGTPAPSRAVYARLYERGLAQHALA